MQYNPDRIHHFSHKCTLYIIGFSNGEQFDSICLDHHWVKSVHIRSYSGPYFPAFGLNTERYGVSLRIQSKCGKIRTRITPNTDTFYAVYIYQLVESVESHGKYEGNTQLFNSSSVVCYIGSKRFIMRTNFIRPNKLRLAQKSFNIPGTVVA